MTRPLPLRIDPRPGESWLGYLHRNTRVYRLDTTTRVLDQLLCTSNARSRPRTRRGYGIAALPSTYQRLGDYFNLAPTEVRAMFVESYTTVTSQWTDTDRQRFDLFADGGETHVWAPGVRSSRQLVRCSACQSEDPDRWELSWWLTAQAVCDRHALTLTPPGERGIEVGAPIAAQQKDVLKIAAGNGARVPWTDSDTFMSDLTVMASGWGHHPITLETLVPAARHLLRQPGLRPLPAEYAEPTLHRVYGSRTTHDLGYPWGDPTRSRLILDLLALPQPPAYAALVRYRTAPVPVLEDVPQEPRFYPILLPTNLYLKHFAMMCDHLSINRGRRLTAAAVWHVTVGPPWGHGPARTMSSRPLATLQAHLDRHGRLEQFWANVITAATAMAEDPIDYEWRRNQINTSQLDALTQATTQHTIPDLELWLHLHWACHPSPGPRDHIEFHRQYGTQLDRTVGQVLAAQQARRSVGRLAP